METERKQSDTPGERGRERKRQRDREKKEREKTEKKRESKEEVGRKCAMGVLPSVL